VRVLLIVNETASSVTARRRVLIQRLLGADHKLEVAETSRRGHAARIARGAALDNVEVVAVLAGDGTLNEAADGIAGTNTALAALPGGSTNVFARSIGVAYDPVEAAEQLVHSLEQRSFRRIGLGIANGRRFLFHAGAGLDAAVIAQVERRSFLKRYAAHPVFVGATIDTWLRHYDHRRPRFKVEVDDLAGSPSQVPAPATKVGEAAAVAGHVVGDSAFAIISNQRPWTYLGRRPLTLSPHAGLDVPLTLTMFRSLEVSLLLRAFTSALRGGRMFSRHPKLAERTDLRSLTITGYGPFPWQVDGDYMGDTERLDITWQPDFITIVLPELGERRPGRR
jgi:diacylglycerol kinase family enzyme